MELQPTPTTSLVSVLVRERIISRSTMEADTITTGQICGDDSPVAPSLALIQ